MFRRTLGFFALLIFILEEMRILVFFGVFLSLFLPGCLLVFPSYVMICLAGHVARRNHHPPMRKTNKQLKALQDKWQSMPSRPARAYGAGKSQPIAPARPVPDRVPLDDNASEEECLQYWEWASN
jgi:hypothetical protein